MSKCKAFYLVICLYCFSVNVQASCDYFNDFVDNHDGTVTDPRSGTIWQRCDVGQDWNGNSCVGTKQKLDWFDGMKAAKSNRFLNKTDWRLPTINELSSILGKDGQCYVKNDFGCERAVSDLLLRDRDVDHYWSSSPASKNEAHFVSFCYGIKNTGESAFRVNQGNIKLLRNGESNKEFAREYSRINHYRTELTGARVGWTNNIRRETSEKAKRPHLAESSVRSGGFRMYVNSPYRDKFGNSSTIWQASCDEGGDGVVTMEDSSPNFYCWSSHDKNSAHGCEAGIGAEAAMRNACR